MIELERNGNVWLATIARPDKANALTKEMLAELAAITRRASAEGAGALILTGAGKVFCSGADLDEARAGLATDPVWEELSGAIAAAPMLTVAALNGTLAGGACGMVLACDLRIAVASAKVFYPVMKLGFLPQPSDPARLVRLVGPARAKMILMAGARIEAPEALAWGLLDRLVEPGALIDTAKELVADACAAKDGLPEAIKRMIDAG